MFLSYLNPVFIAVLQSVGQCASSFVYVQLSLPLTDV